MKPAFSIIEAIVTIAVLALLAGLLLPALSTTRGAGRASECRSNLRQLVVAANVYTTLFDAYPVALRYDDREGDLRQVAWDWTTTLGGELIGPGALWSCADEPGRVQQCPEYHGPSNAPGDPHTGYNYNTTYVGGEAPYGQAGWSAVRRGVRPHECRRGATVAMFGDGGYRAGANKFMRAPTNRVEGSLWTVYAGGQAFRHRGRTNVAYLDGHVGGAERAHEGIHATPDLLETILDHPRNGFLSDDDTAYDPR